MYRAFVWIIPLLLLGGWCAPPAVDAVQEPRYLFNVYRTNVKLIAVPEQGRHSQIFQNNLDHLDTITLQIGGYVTIDLPDSLTVTILDGCGTQLFSTTIPLDTSALTSDEAFKDVAIPVGIELDYGRYYMLEVSTLRASFAGGAKLVLNTDQASGRHVDGSASLVYPRKKEDILYYLSGTADSSKPFFPPWFDLDHPTNPVTPFNTNVMCPGRCIPLVPGEHAEYIAEFRFNVIIREQTATNKGSFWSDFQADPTLATLRENIRQMLEGDATSPGVRETAPYNEFYPFMNFYIAVEDPANDPDSLRGFLHCANIDAAIDVVTGPLPYGGGSFTGGVQRKSTGDVSWGQRMRSTLLHELFGHGIAQLADEYVNNTLPLAPGLSLYRPNSDPIGCPSWCASYKTIATLEHEIIAAGDPSRGCFDFDDRTCQQFGVGVLSTEPRCYFLGAITPAIPYFEGRRCVPRSIMHYNMGLSCAGNSECYIGEPFGTSLVRLNVAQPNSTIMQSVHNWRTDGGYTTGVEDTIRTLMHCMFPIQPCANPMVEACEAFERQWNGTSERYANFAQFGRACILAEDGSGMFLIRRR